MFLVSTFFAAASMAQQFGERPERPSDKCIAEIQAVCPRPEFDPSLTREQMHQKMEEHRACVVNNKANFSAECQEHISKMEERQAQWQQRGHGQGGGERSSGRGRGFPGGGH